MFGEKYKKIALTIGNTKRLCIWRVPGTGGEEDEAEEAAIHLERQVGVKILIEISNENQLLRKLFYYVKAPGLNALLIISISYIV
ncbi:MAG: hypothetical protein GY754_35240 [bacterium]|nr:hypothetical protein [bacterium]